MNSTYTVAFNRINAIDELDKAIHPASNFVVDDLEHFKGSVVLFNQSAGLVFGEVRSIELCEDKRAIDTSSFTADATIIKQSSTAFLDRTASIGLRLNSKE